MVLQGVIGPRWLGSFFMTCVMVVVIGMAGIAGASQQNQNSLSGFQEGVITSVGQKSIHIDKKSYDLDKDLSITLDAGAKRTKRALKNGILVKFTLEKGLVTQIVIIQPN